MCLCALSEECVLNDFAHLPYHAYVEVVVEDKDIGVLATGELAFAVVAAHDVGWGLADHAACVFQWYEGLLYGGAYQAVHGGD